MRGTAVSSFEADELATWQFVVNVGCVLWPAALVLDVGYDQLTVVASCEVQAILGKALNKLVRDASSAELWQLLLRQLSAILEGGGECARLADIYHRACLQPSRRQDVVVARAENEFFEPQRLKHDFDNFVSQSPHLALRRIFGHDKCVTNLRNDVSHHLLEGFEVVDAAGGVEDPPDAQLACLAWHVRANHHFPWLVGLRKAQSLGLDAQ